MELKIRNRLGKVGWQGYGQGGGKPGKAFEKPLLIHFMFSVKAQKSG